MLNDMLWEKKGNVLVMTIKREDIKVGWPIKINDKWWRAIRAETCWVKSIDHKGNVDISHINEVQEVTTVFKAGDEVIHPERGWWNRLTESQDCPGYPLLLEFNDRHELFTTDGKLREEDVMPSLILISRPDPKTEWFEQFKKDFPKGARYCNPEKSNCCYISYEMSKKIYRKAYESGEKSNEK